MDGAIIGILLLAATATGVPIFLLFNHRKAERAEAEKLRGQFRDRVEGYVNNRQLGRLKLFRLAEQMGVPRAEASEVGEEIYRRLAQIAVRDGRITEKEAVRLEQFAEALKVSNTAKQAAEHDAKLEIVTKAVDKILADGRVTPQESARLDSLAEDLGLTRRAVQEHVAEQVAQAFTRKIHGLMHHGHFTAKDEAEVRQFREAFSLGTAAATRLLERDANKFLREFLTDLAERDDASPESEEDLRRLARVLGIQSDALRPYLDRLSRLIALAEIRRGNLGTVQCPLELASGELCHWFGPVEFIWEVQSGRKNAEGTLAVTSQRLIFTSPTKNFALKPKNIVRLETRHGSGIVQIHAAVNTGGGWYAPKNWEQGELFSAVLSGLVKKVNFRAERPADAPTRHIPDAVKQEVWFRDAGRCVRCNAEDYLEFDHVIPHSKGGANTVGNIQLLCRRCNNEKSDRI